MSDIILFPYSIFLHSKAQRGIYLAKEGRLTWQHGCVRSSRRSGIMVKEARMIVFWTEKTASVLDATIYVKILS